MSRLDYKAVQRWVIAGIALAGLTYQAIFAAQVLRSDPVYFAAQRQVVYWGQDGITPSRTQVVSVLEAVNAALAAWPENADYLSLQARLHLWQALSASGRAAANQHLEDALQSMEQSFRYRPASPYAWLQYAEYRAARRNDGSALESAIRKVQDLGPGDPGLQAAALALRPR